MADVAVTDGLEPEGFGAAVHLWSHRNNMLLFFRYYADIRCLNLCRPNGQRGLRAASRGLRSFLRVAGHPPRVSPNQPLYNHDPDRKLSDARIRSFAYPVVYLSVYLSLTQAGLNGTIPLADL